MKRIDTFCRGLTCIVMAFAVGSVSDHALAQEPSIEEVVVTARKREESLQEIPLSITVFDGEALERNRIENIIDVAKYTPGLVFDEVTVIPARDLL